MADKTRHSEQRDLILREVRSRHDHPTAEEVFVALRPGNPRLSLGTVYRNLHLLADRGEIRSISVPSGPDRFDRTLDPHSHFVCTDCGCFLDFSFEMPELPQPPANGCVVEHCEIIYSGLCADCAARKRSGETASA